MGNKFRTRGGETSSLVVRRRAPAAAQEGGGDGKQRKMDAALEGPWPSEDFTRPCGPRCQSHRARPRRPCPAPPVPRPARDSVTWGRPPKPAMKGAQFCDTLSAAAARGGADAAIPARGGAAAAISAFIGSANP